MASIAIDEGRIVAIGSNSSMPNADKIIDARGLVVIPGGIDAHVHIGQPWEGTNRPVYYEEDVQSGTRQDGTGQEVYVETTPHYLYLEDKDMEKRGPWVKCSPPLRDKDRVLRIRRLLAQEHVDTLRSDHSPFRKEEVEAAMDNTWKAEAGMPGIETILPLLINGVSEGWVSLNRVVACLCENPSRIYDDWVTETRSEDGKPMHGLNGDILVWNPVTKRRHELTSMGIRVNAETLKKQLEISGQLDFLKLPYHQGIINSELPLSIGGGIGQSRTYMLLLRKAQLGEVSVTVWPKILKEICAKKNIHVLE